jgi:hypothetical protein
VAAPVGLGELSIGRMATPMGDCGWRRRARGCDAKRPTRRGPSITIESRCEMWGQITDREGRVRVGLCRTTAAPIAALAGVVLAIALAGCQTTASGSFADNPVYSQSPTTGGAFDPTTLRSSDPRSLLLASHFPRAFAIAERTLGAAARIESAEVYPGQLALTVLEHGRQISFAVQYNGIHGSKSGGPPSGTPTTFSLSQLAADAPDALVSRIAAAAQIPASRIKYVIVSPNPGGAGLYWQLYTADTADYFAATSTTSPIQEYRGSKATTLR